VDEAPVTAGMESLSEALTLAMETIERKDIEIAELKDRLGEGNRRPPQLLRIPEHFHSVWELLNVARQLNLSNAVLISEREDGSVVFLDSALNSAEANWLVDRIKKILLA
jgi:hypothetical protein